MCNLSWPTFKKVEQAVKVFQKALRKMFGMLWENIDCAKCEHTLFTLCTNSLNFNQNSTITTDIYIYLFIILFTFAPTPFWKSCFCRHSSRHILQGYCCAPKPWQQDEKNHHPNTSGEIWWKVIARLPLWYLFAQICKIMFPVKGVDHWYLY